MISTAPFAPMTAISADGHLHNRPIIDTHTQSVSYSCHSSIINIVTSGRTRS